jgi:hypothetical protein
MDGFDRGETPPASTAGSARSPALTGAQKSNQPIESLLLQSRRASGRAFGPDLGPE